MKKKTPKARNWLAVHAHQRGGAGLHSDKRKEESRTACRGKNKIDQQGANMNRHMGLLEKLSSWGYEEERTKERWNELPPWRVVSRSLKIALSCWEDRYEAQQDLESWIECGIPEEDLEVFWVDYDREWQSHDSPWRHGRVHIASKREMKAWFETFKNRTNQQGEY